MKRHLMFYKLQVNISIFNIPCRHVNYQAQCCHYNQRSYLYLYLNCGRYLENALEVKEIKLLRFEIIFKNLKI